MLRSDCKPGPLESRPPAIKPAGPIIAGRACLQPGPAYICANEQTAERHKQERRDVVPARVALAITCEEAWCRLELRWP